MNLLSWHKGILLNDIVLNVQYPVTNLYTLEQKCLNRIESHTNCQTICQPLVVFVSAGSGDMITFLVQFKPIFIVFLATLVLKFRLLVTRWHSFMWHYSTENPTTNPWSTLLQLLFSGELSGKGMWNHTTMNVDPHIVLCLKGNE